MYESVEDTIQDKVPPVIHNIMSKMNWRTFWISILILSVLGMSLRWMGIWYEGVDYRTCLQSWYMQLKEGGSLAALADYEGDYNVPYATVLYWLTLIPVKPIIGIKMFSILFDYLNAFLLTKMVMVASGSNEKIGAQGYFYGILTYGLVLCNPIAVINSGYLAQSDGIWTYFALLSFWFIWQERPVRGMWAMGAGIAMKLQSVFIMPVILIYYFHKRKFSILHLLWIPVAIQTLCIPAIIGGCRFDIAYTSFSRLLGEYPFMYYYYPNIWTYFKEVPYYLFGKYAIMITFIALLMFAVLYVQSGRIHTLHSYMEYVMWTTMTCAMLLPCMHERYNYIAEIMLPVCAIFNRKLRLPVTILLLISMQCYGQSYLEWGYVSHYILAAGNLLIYFYLTWRCFYGLYNESKVRREKNTC